MQHTLIQHCLICLIVFWFSFVIYPTTAPMLLVKQICDRSNSNMTTSINQHGLGANTKIYVETLSGKPRGMSKSTTTQSTNEYNNLLKSLTQRFKEPNSKEEKIQVPLKRDLQSKSPFDCIERQFVFIHDIFLSCVFVWICLWFLRSLSDSKDMMPLFEESLFKFLHRRLGWEDPLMFSLMQFVRVCMWRWCCSRGRGALRVSSQQEHSEQSLGAPLLRGPHIRWRPHEFLFGPNQTPLKQSYIIC